MAEQKLVKVRIGKHLPSLQAKPGDSIEVTPQMAESFKSRRMLYEQVEQDTADKRASKARIIVAEEDRNSESLRHIIKEQSTKLSVAQDKILRLEKDLEAGTTALREAIKRAETAEAELARKPK